MTTPPCAFAHRLFPGLRRRRPEAPGPPTGSCGDRPTRACRPRTASSSRRLGRDRRPVEVKDVPVAHRSPRSACLTVGGGPQPALARAFSEPPLLHEGRDLLAKGCAYCTKAPPTQSASHPPPVAPHPRRTARLFTSRGAAAPENLAVNNADAAASREGCCGVGGRLDRVEGGVQPRVTWRARGSPGGGSAWWRSAGGSP